MTHIKTKCRGSQFFYQAPMFPLVHLSDFHKFLLSKSFPLCHQSMNHFSQKASGMCPIISILWLIFFKWTETAYSLRCFLTIFTKLYASPDKCFCLIDKNYFKNKLFCPSWKQKVIFWSSQELINKKNYRIFRYLS